MVEGAVLDLIQKIDPVRCRNPIIKKTQMTVLYRQGRGQI